MVFLALYRLCKVCMVLYGFACLVYFYGGLKSRDAFRCLTEIAFHRWTFVFIFVRLGLSFLLSSLFLPVSSKYVAAWVVISIKSRKLSGNRTHCFESMREQWIESFDSLTSAHIPIVFMFTFCISIPNNHRHEIFRRWLSLVKLLTLFCRKCRQLFQYVSCWVSILWSVLCRVLYAHPLRPHFLDLFETFWSYLIILIFKARKQSQIVKGSNMLP